MHILAFIGNGHVRGKRRTEEEEKGIINLDRRSVRLLD